MMNLKPPNKTAQLKNLLIPLNKVTVDIIRDLNGYFEDDSEKVVLWLTTENPNFGNAAPIRLMQIGREHKVAEFIKNARWESLP